MTHKLCDAAQARWRHIDGHYLVALVRVGTVFIDANCKKGIKPTTSTPRASQPDHGPTHDI